MKQGDKITIEATVLRVDGDFLHAQTPNGQLIQTSVSNCMTEEKKTESKKEDKPKTDKKSVGLSEHKAELNAPENKSGK